MCSPVWDLVAVSLSMWCEVCRSHHSRIEEPMHRLRMRYTFAGSTSSVPVVAGGEAAAELGSVGDAGGSLVCECALCLVAHC